MDLFIILGSICCFIPILSFRLCFFGRIIPYYFHFSNCQIFDDYLTRRFFTVILMLLLGWINIRKKPFYGERKLYDKGCLSRKF